MKTKAKNLNSVIVFPKVDTKPEGSSINDKAVNEVLVAHGSEEE